MMTGMLRFFSGSGFGHNVASVSPALCLWHAPIVSQDLGLSSVHFNLSDLDEFKAIDKRLAICGMIE